MIHDLAHPYETLRAIRAALRPGGALLMAEHALSSDPDVNVANPFAAALYTVSRVPICMPASLSEHGEGLGLAWGDDANPVPRSPMPASTSVDRQTLERDPLNAGIYLRCASTDNCIDLNEDWCRASGRRPSLRTAGRGAAR